MGRCGPGCGSINNNDEGYYNDSYGGEDWRSNSDNYRARDGSASKHDDIICKKREVYYEKEDCYKSRNDECRANKLADGYSSRDRRSDNYGSSGSDYDSWGGDYGFGDRGFGDRGYGYRSNFGRYGAPCGKLQRGLGYNTARRSMW